MTGLRSALAASFVLVLLHPSYGQEKPEAPPPSKAAPLGTTSAPKAEGSGAMSATTGAKSGGMKKGHKHKH